MLNGHEVKLTCGQQSQVDHPDCKQEWEAEAGPQVPVNDEVNGTHTCPSIRLSKLCTIRGQTFSAEDNLQSEGACNSRRFRVYALLQAVPKFCAQ